MSEPILNNRIGVTVVLGFAVLAHSITEMNWTLLALIPLSQGGDYVFVSGRLFAIASALNFGMLSCLVRS